MGQADLNRLIFISFYMNFVPYFVILAVTAVIFS